MHDLPAHCKAIKEHTGDYVCNRCGLYWDAKDTPPKCKTCEELKAHEELKTKQTGREALDYLKKILPPSDER